MDQSFCPVGICFVNFYDVGDELLLRWEGSGIGSVSLFVSNMLTLDGSKLVFGVHLLVNSYDVVDGVVLLFYFDCAFAFSISMTW